MDSKIYDVYTSMLLDVQILKLENYIIDLYVYLSNVSIASWLDPLNNN